MVVERINLISAGTMVVPGPEVFWMEQFETQLPLSLWIVVLRVGRHVVLINTGPANTQMGAVAQPKDSLEHQLRKIGVEPAMVDFVVITPFQYYTLGNLALFSHATLCLSRTGWLDFHAPKWKNHPHEHRNAAIPPAIVHDLVGSWWERVRLLNDHDTLLPGIQTHWAGCHHRSSMIVLADTEKGRMAITDVAFYADNIRRNRPIGISESLDECLTSYEFIRSTADILLPLYDPHLAEEYPDGVVNG